jgi:DNA-binding NarL/FixJ family response regulator
MKKINITVVCEEQPGLPGCAELLADYPTFNIVAQPLGLDEPGIWVALGRSDVLVLDEHVMEEAGFQAIRSLHDYYPSLRSLMVVEGEHKYKTLAAVSLGILGVIGRSSTVAMLHKAVIALYSGEAWLSRGLAQPLRDQVNREEDDLNFWADLSTDLDYRGKLN